MIFADQVPLSVEQLRRLPIVIPDILFRPIKAKGRVMLPSLSPAVNTHFGAGGQDIASREGKRGHSVVLLGKPPAGKVGRGPTAIADDNVFGVSRIENVYNGDIGLRHGGRGWGSGGLWHSWGWRLGSSRCRCVSGLWRGRGWCCRCRNARQRRGGHGCRDTCWCSGHDHGRWGRGFTTRILNDRDQKDATTA